MVLSPKFLIGVAAGAATGYVIGQVSCGVPLGTAVGRVLNPAAILGAIASTFKAAGSAGSDAKPEAVTYIPPSTANATADAVANLFNSNRPWCPPGTTWNGGSGRSSECRRNAPLNPGNMDWAPFMKA